MNNVVFLLDDVGPMLELCLTWCLNLLDDVWMSTWFFLSLIFLNFILLIWILINPNFDQDLYNSKTSKWITKPGSFLVNLKWSCGEVFEIFMKNVLKWGSKGRVNGLISKQGFFRPCLNQPNNFPKHIFYIYGLCALVFPFFDFF
mgnify:CR=1 FL=1